MRKFNFFLLVTVSLVLCGCSEFSEQEQEILKTGRIYNEAIATDYYRTFIGQWNETLVPLITEFVQKTNSVAQEEYEEQKKKENIAKIFWGNSSWLFVDEKAESQYNNRIQQANYYVETMQKIYTGFCKYICTEIQENGKKETITELDSVLMKIESDEDYWSWAGVPYDLDVKGLDTFGSRIGTIVCTDPEGSFTPNHNLYNADWKLSSSWAYPLSVAFKDDEGTDDFGYQLMKTTQYWLKHINDISIDYCTKVDDSENSYLIGYSNQTAFMVTFVRNDKDDFRFQWESSEYDSKLVGNSLIK